jgi:hypothetical protein
MAEACNVSVTEQQNLSLREISQLLVIYGMRHVTGTMLPAIKCQTITRTNIPVTEWERGDSNDDKIFVLR